jgi:predicted dehydrogenase/threonine dehydrogenase-like Zn-dependent dehydrogenase
MKQIILPFNTGIPQLEDVPAPVVQPGQVLIRTTASVVSSGTERMLMDFGKAGWIGKARQQPERVRQVLIKVKTDGLVPTINAVKSKMDAPIPLGYSSAGVVLAVGDGVTDIRIGDHVASNGSHAEIVSVPRNLVAKIPDGVRDEAAAFTVLGAIALQGIRLVNPGFGETVVVYGLGLVGQLTAQLLIANGCRVIGVDLHASRLALAAGQGVQILSEASGDAVRAITNGYGADAVIITASSESDEIIATAADMCRKRGRIVLTGVVGLQLSRDHFFKKELTFQVSASYGPGRYEPQYEQHGLDYPIGYVRWTEGRNFEAVLQAMANGQLDTASLITARKPVEAFAEVYELLGNAETLATVFTYSETPDIATYIRKEKGAIVSGKGAIGVIGAGAFTAGILLPALKDAGGIVKTVISKNGLSATTLSKKYGIAEAGTDYKSVLLDEGIGAVVITTPHNTHAAIAAEALRAGKHVLVEKPLALSRDEVADIIAAHDKTNAGLTVGFNRRYAPLAIKTKALIGAVAAPKNIIITVNAGAIPREHWIQDPAIGGGRILGEACHFIDLCSYFTGTRIEAVCANAMAGNEGVPDENVSILLRYTDGSTATVHYFSNGSKAHDKERIELYSAGHTIVIQNWRSIKSYGFKKDISVKNTQDKGHAALINAWIKSIKEGGAPIMHIEEIINSTLATIAAQESITANSWIAV